jgi:hypothetical protein
MKLTKDFRCVLKDKRTNAKLIEFDAMQVGDAIFGAGYAGNIASSPQDMTIATEFEYPFKAMENKVEINGREWVIASVTPSIRRKLGAGVAKKPKTVYVLRLE